MCGVDAGTHCHRSRGLPSPRVCARYVQGWVACGRGRTPGYARDSGRYWEIVHIQGAGVGWGGVGWVGMRWMVRLGGPNLPSLIELHTHQP